jgi:hypothetical protein
MTALAAPLRRLIEALLWPFDQLPPLLGLLLLSVLSGVAMLAVVGLTTPQRRLRVARDLMSSAIYEIRLFLDSPGHIVRAQLRLLVYSTRYLLCLVPALLVLLPPLALLFAPLHARYGLAPLSPDGPALLRIQLDPAAAATLDPHQISLAPAEAVQLDAPPVLVADEAVMYLRLRLRGPGIHQAVVRAPSWTVDKRISAQPGAAIVDVERRRGLGSLLAIGTEPALPSAGPVQVLALDHPQRPPPWETLPAPWWLLWLLVATATALALRRRMGVTL